MAAKAAPTDAATKARELGTTVSTLARVHHDATAQLSIRFDNSYFQDEDDYKVFTHAAGLNSEYCTGAGEEWPVGLDVLDRECKKLTLRWYNNATQHEQAEQLAKKAEFDDAGACIKEPPPK
ncbi:hypothetical protein HDV00_005658 [Rhizophlyctis rosea]|nr:hypothetical protein HDV00_005658 [Rhizophlyctis rosea]